MGKHASITFLSGKRGSGKTTKLLELIKNEKRVIVFDCMGDWGDNGFQSFTSMKQVVQHVRDNWNKGFRVALNVFPVKNKSKHLPKALSQFSEVLMAMQMPYKQNKDSREITLVVDEMRFSVPNRPPESGEAAFFDLIQIGRHYGINIIGATQRPAQVHKDFTGNSEDLYFFKVGDHNDVKAIKPLIGKEWTQTLVGLQNFEFIHWKDINNIQKGKTSL